MFKTEEQEALCLEIERFAKEQLSEGAFEEDRDAAFPREKWRACGEAGLHGLLIPEVYGGKELDPLSFAMALETLGYHCADNSLPFAICAQLISTVPILVTFGTDEQKEKYLPAVARGDLIGTHALTEEDHGSDALSAMSTTARKVKDGYVLDGTKSYITSAPESDFSIIFARSDEQSGAFGSSAFLVDHDLAGVTLSPVRPKMGLRSTQMGDIILKEVKVPESSRLGSEGGGFAIFSHTIDWERAYIAAANVGRMKAQLDASVQFANQRKSGGNSIGKYQAISHRIADMKIRHATCRALLYDLARKHAEGASITMDAAIAKVHISESFFASSTDAMRIHGARGYVSEFEIERDLRDAAGGYTYSGTSDVNKNIIARHLGVR